jgi:threonine dehydratase
LGIYHGLKNLHQDVLVAAERIRDHVRRTPFDYSPPLSELTGADVWLKLENLQYTGSFKVRGAMNKLLSLNTRERELGVVAASTGNHGAAVAFGCQKLGISGLVYVPENTSDAKLENMRNYLADIRFHGMDCVDAEAKARTVAKKRDMIYLSPYNDPMVVAGQGTAGVEIESQCDRLDVLIVSVGGGGLIGGISSYLKSVWPDLHVIGCSPENSSVMIKSLAVGRVLDLESLPTLSDGTAGGVEPDAITFSICQDVIDETVLVTEVQIRDGALSLIEKQHQLVEGAAGTAMAALMIKKEELKGQRVGLVVCGGNISINTLQEILCKSSV